MKTTPTVERLETRQTPSAGWSAIDPRIDWSTDESGFRISNAQQAGYFGGWPVSPSVPAAPQLSLDLWFKAVAPGDNSQIEVDFNTDPDTGASERTTWLGLFNTPDGLDVKIWDNAYVPIASIDPYSWHHLHMATSAGPLHNDDRMEVTLDGNYEGSFPTLESFYWCRDQLTYPSSAVYFRAGFPAEAPQGFLFDDFVLTNGTDTYAQDFAPSVSHDQVELAALALSLPRPRRSYTFFDTDGDRLTLSFRGKRGASLTAWQEGDTIHAQITGQGTLTSVVRKGKYGNGAVDLIANGQEFAVTGRESFLAALEVTRRGK